MTGEGYEYFDVTAAVGVRARGDDLRGCLRQCALGVFNLIVPIDAVQAVESREVSARGASPEALVVNWLNECLYVHDIEGFVVRDVTRPTLTAASVHGILHGEPIDAARHPRGRVVRAATFRGLEVVETPDQVTARVILDT